MWLWSSEADDVLRASHTAVCRVDILQSGRRVYQLNATAGSVSLDADRPVRANLTCTLVDPTGALTSGDVDDLLDPYECEIQPWRGVRLVDTLVSSTLTPVAGGLGVQPLGTSGLGGVTATVAATVTTEDEMAPLGVFGLTSRQVSHGDDGLTIQITGQDRAMNYQVPMDSALAIPGATTVQRAIQRLLSVAHAGLVMQTMETGYTCGPLLYAPDIDVWREAQDLAISVGAQLFHDRTGRLVLGPTGPQNWGDPVAVYKRGDGLLVSLQRAEDSDTIRNAVVAERPDGLIRVEVSDTEPTSPTYVSGRYGRRPFTLTNQNFGSLNQARQAGAAELVRQLGRAETVSFTAVPDPGLDVDDVVTVHDPDAGLTFRAMQVATIDMPLAADEPMTVGLRKSVLTTTGRVLKSTQYGSA